MKYHLICLALLPALAQAFDSGSSGADGAFNPTSNITLQLPESGILNYTTINIPAGVTVKFKRNTLNTPVQILASGDVSIDGVIDVSGDKAYKVGADTQYPDFTTDGLPGLGGPGGFDGGRGGRVAGALIRAHDWTGVETSYVPMYGGAGQGPGGGGGGKAWWTPDSSPDYMGPAGGAGGSYAAPAMLPNFSHVPNMGLSLRYFNAAIGKVYGSSWLRVLLGGSGGGGGAGGNNIVGSGGGGGGGALLIAASGKVTINGKVLANGGAGGDIAGANIGSNATYIGGWGGGGAGGAIRVVASQITGAGELAAKGGGGNVCTSGATCRSTPYSISHSTAYLPDMGTVGRGSAGSHGRIRLESQALAFTGTATPSAVTSVEPAPALPQALPSLQIVSVAGANAPAKPTGSVDMILPGDITNPVTVAFATSGIPLSNIVELMVVPSFGDKIIVKSAPITGTVQNGSTSVQVALPPGSSVLTASTTYTLTVAAGEALSRFANNERVVQVKLIAGLDQSQRARLITVSGKEFDVALEAVSNVLG
ncbi:hypothetical protein [Chitinolyticbacter albus]|uniref:hypothetical protein n=1 Tax=Chitinolyticbacter albus TaxID=2961951 RepID=UPI00210A97C3|nr:hypothetical protein [Chitinolyticbacter albus]